MSVPSISKEVLDSGHGGSSVGSHSPSNPLPEAISKGVWQPNGLIGHPHNDAEITKSPNHQTKFRELVNNSSGRKQQVAMLPNSGPPPRHLLPAKLKPSPAVKMHPPGVILDFKGKAALFSQLISDSS